MKGKSLSGWAPKGNAVSLLHANFQLVNFQRWEHALSRELVHVSGVHRRVHASSTSGCACVYFTVQQCSICISSPGFPEASGKATVMQRVLLKSASCCSVLLYFSRCCAVRLKMFSFFFVTYFLCEKYYKPIIIIQYYTVDCVSWVLRLTSLDLMNNLDLWTYSWNGACWYVGDLL